MTDFIQNPRRAPRAPVRCRATVVSASGTYEATTEDVGGHGCQLVSPRLVRKGEPIQLLVSHEGVEPLRVTGRVAWSSDRAPWRLGIAYDEASHPQTSAWFDQLLAAVPGLPTFRRIPDQIPVDAVIYLASPPRFLVDFTPGEVALLRAIGSGTSVAELRALLHDRWPRLQHALFSLLAHQHVTLTRGASVHPDAWRKILSEVEASLAVEDLRTGPASPPAAPAARPPAPTRPALVAMPAPPPAPAGPVFRTSPTSPVWPAASPPSAPAQRPAPLVPTPAEAQLAAVEAPAALADAPESWLVPAAELVPAAWPRPGLPPAPGQGARGLTRGLDGGVPWSGTPPPLTGGYALAPARSAEAQGCYERALAELEAGRSAGAAALLRRALALAPGDPEIAGALARVGARRG
ncbi:MAG TPA: PilZ domain-containing protein [Anaeromyxobacter sp.]|nr:PilZ domain-containing protein [Anaeromyxobacter sp.]